MTYLELVNEVLVRLREDELPSPAVDPAVFLTDPYYKSIGAHINDAKDRVEDAWQWGALRGTDRVPETGNQEVVRVVLPNSSSDDHHVIKRVMWNQAEAPETKYTFLRQVSIEWIRARYADSSATQQVQVPGYFAVTGTDEATGNVELTIYPPPLNPNPDVGFVTVDRVAHQPRLTLATDVLKVPSLPVYTLATALASRERGEVGGTPTSELFAIADRHLSDAIATDSAMYANELDWFSDQVNWHNTNVRSA